MSQNRVKTTTRIRISPAALTGDKRSPAGLFGSFVLHGAVIAATMFTWTHRLDITDESAPVVPVDLVTIAPKTNVMPSVRPEPRLKPIDTIAPPTPQDIKVPTPTLPQQQAETPPAPPEPKPPEPIAKPPSPPQETEAAEPIAKAPPSPPKTKPKPAPEKEKKNFDVDNVLALLNKVAPAPSASSSARTSSRAVKGIGAETAMTADLQDALRSQIQPCWNPPIGAPNAKDLVVSFDLILNSDGSVAQPPQLAADSAAAAARDPYVRAAAEAARRAIYTCAPYKLPADRYSQWREIDPFIFDPTQMLGQ